MIGKNSDLQTVCAAIDREMSRLGALKAAQGLCTELGGIDVQLAALSRQRRAICAAAVNRQIEASREVVSLSIWRSGNGALDDLCNGLPIGAVGPRLIAGRAR